MLEKLEQSGLSEEEIKKRLADYNDSIMFTDIVTTFIDDEDDENE